VAKVWTGSFAVHVFLTFLGLILEFGWGASNKVFASGIIRPLHKLCSGGPWGARKCKVAAIKPKWQAIWTYNVITSLLLNGTFIGRTTDLEKTANINWLVLPFSLSVAKSAEAFLYKGNVYAHDYLSTYDVIHGETTTAFSSAQSSPKAQFYRYSWCVDLEC